MKKTYSPYLLIEVACIMQCHEIPRAGEQLEARDVEDHSDEDGRDEQWDEGKLLDAQQPDHSQLHDVQDCQDLVEHL